MASQGKNGIATTLAVAALMGGAIGVASVAMLPRGQTIAQAASDAAVAGGLRRQRAPRAGDYWSGCNDARRAGTAPIYRHEPGYRLEMDGDDDGIACEPI